LFLTSCAAYHPAPLSDDVAVLSAPVAAVLAQQSRAITRPYLAPVAVNLSAPLDLNSVAVIAVINNPDLRAQRVRAQVADAQIFAARLLPDPTLGAGIDHILSGPDPLDAIMAQIGFDIGALRARKTVLAGEKASASVVRLDLAWAEWQAAGQAKLQAVRLGALAGAEAIALQSKASADSLLSRNLRAAGRGDIRAEDVEARRLAAIDAATQARTVESDHATARLELNRVLGLPPETILRLGSLSLGEPKLDSARLFAIAVKERLDLQALKAGYSAQEAAVHKAVLDQFPNLSLAITGARDNTGNKLLGPSVGFSLPLWNRNRGGIAVAEATRAALKAEYEARLFQTRAEIAAAVGGLELARRQRAELSAQIPPLARFAAATRRAATRGDLALATAETAEQSLRDKQLALVQVEQAVTEQLIALELLTGTVMGNWK
jgi:outer membrane protein, heavy metal efflux system